jgi:hypothetical protein
MTSGPQLTNSLLRRGYGALDPPVGGTFHFENLKLPIGSRTFGEADLRPC